MFLIFPYNLGFFVCLFVYVVCIPSISSQLVGIDNHDTD